MTDRRETAETGAAEWDARLRGARTSQLDHQAFAAWLERDPENRVANGRLQTALATLRANADQGELIALRQQAWNKVQQAKRWRLLTVFAAAAAAVVLVFTGVTMWLHQGTGMIAEHPVADTVFATSPSQRTKVTLADGSVITLDAGTQLTARLGATRRDVTLLSGRALFAVAKDARRPFVVSANGRTITALGTIFDVSLSPRELRVTLAEGAVAVRQARAGSGVAQQILKPRQQFIDRAGAARPMLRYVDAEKALGWTEGQAYFEDEPLSSAVEDMNRGARAEIVVDPTAANLRINGMFRTSNQAGFLEALEIALPVTVRRDGHGRILIAAPPGHRNE